MYEYNPDELKHALERVVYAARLLGEVGYRPGYDVSMYRALRELHRCLGHDESQDPRRLIRGLLFNGLAHMDKS